MVDSSDWLAIYDERIEKVIKADWDSKEELQKRLTNFLVNNPKPRVYYRKDGTTYLDYNHGQRLRSYISDITEKIYNSRKFKTLGTIADETFNATFRFKNVNYLVKFNLKNNKFAFFQKGKRIKRPDKFFIGTKTL